MDVTTATLSSVAEAQQGDGSDDAAACASSHQSSDSDSNYSEEVHRGSTFDKAVIFECNLCATKFSNADNLTRHQRKKSCELPYKCSECGKAFRKQQPLKVHMYEHTGVMPFACEVCQQRFLLPSHLRRHAKGHVERQCRLDGCGQKFATWSALRSHVAKAHAPKVTCDLCDRAFRHPYQLKKHSHIHRKDVKCLVDGCGAMVQRWGMKRHVTECHPAADVKSQLHLMFTCDACGKGFDRAGKLERHVKIHGIPGEDQPSTSQSAPRTFVCRHEGCGKSFARPYKLKAHMNTHLGKKPFKCPEGAACGNRRYSSRQGLKVHLMEHHGMDIRTLDFAAKFADTTTSASEAESEKNRVTPPPNAESSEAEAA